MRSAYIFSSRSVRLYSDSKLLSGFPSPPIIRSIMVSSTVVSRWTSIGVSSWSSSLSIFTSASTSLSRRALENSL